MTEKPQLSRTLSGRHINMIALGGTIGTGLFLGAGDSIQKAGPAILLIYIITGFFVFSMMRALGELLLTDHNQTVFIGFIKKYLGDRAGFIMGWTYWLGWIIIAMAELTAIGKYMQFWLPQTPAWLWELLFLGVLYSMNIIAVKAFGETEFWFALIKIIAIVAMILIGIIMVVFHIRSEAGITQLSTLWQHGLIANHGHNLLAAFQMAFFAFLGVEFVGITAAETKDPLKTIPKSINSIIIRILIFYIGALLAIMTIQPWTNYSANTSPFVQVFSGIGIPAAAGIINFVILTAAASSLNSALFTTGRMIFSLSPKNSFFSQLNSHYIPMRGINLSTALIATVIGLNYIFPEDAFSMVTATASATFIVIYISLLITHIQYRKSDHFINGQKKFLMPFAPFSNYLTIVFMAGVFLILLLSPATMMTTILSIIWFVVLFIISLYKVRVQ
ncbi:MULTISPECIES: amino acid permease [Leuconostoc]|uniref:Amino acid permease n=2 Tax=Leuconostoc kimchii TaxID=136609 RepID=D5T1N4_LEUKI|nr:MULTISPECIES: amino acid permease [Leuconostoc]ADG40183.1 amino acid permease [Leuconostoc kimchii IMSNU 11154]AEJ31876.1 amino acid permease [Leuconostoc sp. C2]QBR46696.1 amino acid permease [Leuconostoc kimchii]